MLQVNGRNVITVSEHAHNTGKTAQTVSTWVKKYTEGGGTLEVAHKVGNMVFFYEEDLNIVANTYERESKDNRKPKRVSGVEYDHLQALYEQALKDLELARHRADSAEDDTKWLQALTSAGVDNWSGYDYARQIYSGEED